MTAVPAQVDGPSDAELIDEVRDGTVSAYGTLYQRHVGAAYNLARQLTRSQAEADDLVSEAFAKVLDTLRAGRGPDTAFRAYLLTTLRHTAYDKTRRDRKVELADDVTAVSGVNSDAVSVPFADTAVAGLDRSLAARAFAALPERWQAVLWHTEIEGQSPAVVAPLLGLTPNGVSALAYRAREGLRQAYLQVHLAESVSDRCRATTERLGAWTRQGLSKREKVQVEAHLDECVRCRALAAELADVNGAMRAVIAPLVLGAGAAGYLALVGAGKAAAATAAVAAGAGAAGSGAAAAAAVPRQLVGVGVGAAAVAAAVAVALAAGPASQTIPQAEQQRPAPATSAPASPAAPVAPAVTPAPVVPPPPAVPAPTTTTAPVVPAPVVPAPANLSVTSPAMPISLVPGGSPVDLPITVRNTGGTLSEPVTAALALPKGVSAIPAAPRLTAPGLLRLDAAPAQSSTVACPGGSGTVTCSSTTGIAPGNSVILLFRLVAEVGAVDGEVTGSISASGVTSVSVAVHVDVLTPAAVDGVSVRARLGWLDRLLGGFRPHPTVDISADNTGTSTAPVTLTLDQPVQLLAGSEAMTCTSTGATTSCTTSGPVAPHHSVWLAVRLTDWQGEPHDQGDQVVVRVAAQLGSARATTSVVLPWWDWPRPGPHQPPTPVAPLAPTTTTQAPHPHPTTGTTSTTTPPDTATTGTTHGPPSTTRSPTTTTVPPAPPGPGHGKGRHQLFE